VEFRPSRDHLARACLVAGALALLARLVYLFEFSDSVFFLSPTLDAAWHDANAKRIAAGHLLDGAPYFRAPLYSWFLALIQALGGTSAWAPRLVQALIGALAASGIAWIAGRLLGTRTGLVAGLVMALYGPLVFSAGELLHEALLVPLLVLSLVFFVKGQEDLPDEDAGALPWFLGGLALGFAAITRPSALAIAPAALAAPWLLAPAEAKARARRLVLPILAGLVLPILPVTAINFISSGDFIPIASQGGINFYAGNNPEADGRHVVIPEVEGSGWSDFEPRVKSIAERAVGRKMRPSEVSDWWAGRGFSWLAENPGAAYRLYVAKTLALLSGYEVPNNRDIYVARRDSRLLSLLVGRAGPLSLPWGLLLPVSLLGIAVLPSRRKLFVILAGAGLYGLSILPFFIADRFRLPLVPLLAIPAAWGLLSIPSLLRAPGRARKALALFAVGLVAGNGGAGADTSGNAADTWHKLGEALYNQERYQAALDAFDEALRLEPANDLPRLGRAHALASLGQDSLAGAEFAAVATRLTGSWQAQYGYGRHLVQAGRTAEAVPYLERAAGLMPDLGELHRELGLAYEAVGNYPAAGLALGHALRLGMSDPEIHLSLGLAALKQGSPEMAANNWNRALELDPGHFRSLYNLALLRFSQGADEEAAELWERAAAVEPDNPLPHFQLARLFQRRGEPERVRREIEAALQRGLPAAEIGRDPLLRNLD
jgi:tetratricopeptide (TPR) repeat protein